MENRWKVAADGVWKSSLLSLSLSVLLLSLLFTLLLLLLLLPGNRANKFQAQLFGQLFLDEVETCIRFRVRIEWGA